jgi:hypothetical protein
MFWLEPTSARHPFDVSHDASKEDNGIPGRDEVGATYRDLAHQDRGEDKQYPSEDVSLRKDREFLLFGCRYDAILIEREGEH